MNKEYFNVIKVGRQNNKLKVIKQIKTYYIKVMIKFA